jgi:hypothetical protein
MFILTKAHLGSDGGLERRASVEEWGMSQLLFSRNG